MTVLKSTSSRYVQNMIENMILTSYSEKSYLVANSGGYIACIQVMSGNKLKHQVSQQFFVVSQIYFVARHNYYSHGGHIMLLLLNT